MEKQWRSVKKKQAEEQAKKEEAEILERRKRAGIETDPNEVNILLFSDSDTFGVFSKDDNDMSYFEGYVEGTIECRLYSSSTQPLGIFVSSCSRNDNNIYTPMVTASVPMETIFSNIKDIEILKSIQQTLEAEIALRGKEKSQPTITKD